MPQYKIFTNREDLSALALKIAKALKFEGVITDQLNEANLSILFFKKKRGYVFDEALLKRQLVRNGIPFVVVKL